MRKKNYKLMIEFKNKIVQLGFGAVGKSFFEKVSKEVKYDKNKYFVISRDKLEYTFFLEMGGSLGNFIVADINRNNYEKIFEENLSEGDILIDFAESVGTKDFVEWCAKNKVMYLNTGETDWSDNWYSILDENLKKNKLRDILKGSVKYPIVLQHGNNPGLVSHFVKAGLEYIVKKQFKKDKKLNDLLEQNKFNDIDLQKVNDKFFDNTLYNTWSIDSFFFEMLSEATANIGTFEKIDYEEICNMVDLKNGFLEFKDIAIDKKGKTFYPKGKFDGFIVPHEETITIAKSLEVKSGEEVIYRPTVLFLYLPCDFAVEYFKRARVTDYLHSDINKTQNRDNQVENSIIRGFKYPKMSEIIYKEKIRSGTEYVGILILGNKFNPVWVGNRVKTNFLYRDKKFSYWQTPTITPVAISALSAFC